MYLFAPKPPFIFIKKLIFFLLLVFTHTAFAQNASSDLFISINSDVNVAKVGDNIIFTINIKNNGTSLATNTRVTDVLPSGYAIVSATPSTGNWTDPIWYIGNLAVNATATIQIEAKINPFGNYTNTVAIKADQPDPNLSDNSAKTTIGVIRAIDDYAYINDSFTGSVVNNILSNDFLNGSFAQISKLNLTEISSSNPNIQLNINTGSVEVIGALAVGNYNLVYQITDKQNPALYSTAKVSINVNKNNGSVADAPILAEHDAGQAPEITGGIAVFNVLANDKLSGKAATLANVNLEFISSTDPKITLDLSSGKVLVAPNTPGGPYILNYKITDKNDLTITASTYVTVNVVGTGALDTKDDYGTINSTLGGIAVSNVLANDLHNGAVVHINDVYLTELFSSKPEITLNINTGEVNVLPGLPNGFYTLTYQVVDKNDVTNKGAADVIIEVFGGVNVIKANEDRGIVNGTTGGIAIQNILENDTLRGVTPTLADVNITQTFSNNSAINLDFNTGQVLVNPGTLNGFFTVTYEIQDKTDLSNTSIADIIVEVQGGISLLTAKEDAGSASGITGGVAVANVLANDDLEGTTPTLNDVIIKQTFTNNPGISLDESTGEVKVAPGTENGVYTLAYYVEDKNKPESTSYADVIVTVTLNNVGVLANPDTGFSNGLSDAVAVNNVLDNDYLDNNKPTISQINLVQISTEHSGVFLDVNTGQVIVNVGTPNGIYVLKYSIEDKANLGSVSIADVTVTVNSGISVIVANEDRGVVNRSTGGVAVQNILVNDSLNSQIPILSQVNILELFSSDPLFFKIDINTGQAIVSPNAPLGFYTLTYQIEDKLNPGSTAVADVIIEVADFGTSIYAAEDNGIASSVIGGTAVANVLANDLADGYTANFSNVDLEFVTSSHNGVSLDIATGAVNVAPNTPSGTYNLIYKITNKYNSNLSVTANVTILVAPPPITAQADAGTVNGFTGGIVVSNILANDSYNGQTATTSNVSISQTTVNPNITINPNTGEVSVAVGTPAGVYTINYSISDKLNPANISNASVVVTVTAPSINAQADAGTVNGFTGGIAVSNILANDSYNGQTATTSNVSISQTTVNPNITINPNTGEVSVTAGTPAGVYTINYSISDKLNPANIIDASVVVTVNPASVLAINDFATIDGKSTVVAIANIVANDLLNNQPTSLSNVEITDVSNTVSGINVDKLTGSVTVDKSVLAGVYVIDYTIKDKLNQSLSSTAKITITVSPNPIIGLSKYVGAMKKEIDGTYKVNYTLHVKNYGNVNLTEIQISDDLVKTFPSPVSFQVNAPISSTGNFQTNQAYNGNSTINLLNAPNNLAPQQQESISFTVNVKLNNTSDTLFYNKAFAEAHSSRGIITDESTNGINPDPNSDGNPVENMSTPILLKQVGIRIPQGFSPNNDGVHDKFVIENTSGATISLEVFNRWGNVVYKSIDYKNEWDGKSNQGIKLGEDLPDGTYYYVVMVNGKDKYVKYLTIKR